MICLGSYGYYLPRTFRAYPKKSERGINYLPNGLPDFFGRKLA